MFSESQSNPRMLSFQPILAICHSPLVYRVQESLDRKEKEEGGIEREKRRRMEDLRKEREGWMEGRKEDGSDESGMSISTDISFTVFLFPTLPGLSGSFVGTNNENGDGYGFLSRFGQTSEYFGPF